MAKQKTIKSPLNQEAAWISWVQAQSLLMTSCMTSGRLSLLCPGFNTCKYGSI